METLKEVNEEVAALLDGLGLAIGARGVEIIDFMQAESCYVHHSTVPVATVGYAIVSPTFARGRFPKLSFIDMMDKRSSMDEREACALAAICGAEVSPPFWGNPKPFTGQLHFLIEKYELQDLFRKNEHAQPGTPFEVDPIGSREAADSDELKAWRNNFKKLSDVQMVIAVGILGLYNARACKEHWLLRVPFKKLHAAEGVEILHKSGAIQDWARLYALYPGW